MKVQIREVDQFNCWFWLHFKDAPTEGERQYIDGLFDSWYVMGRLGGFNAESLQVHQTGEGLNWFEFDNDHLQNSTPAVMHNMGQLEYRQKWARCWIDLGTCDGLAIDVLINSLNQLDEDVVELEEFLIGGVNEDWPIEEHPDAIFPYQG